MHTFHDIDDVIDIDSSASSGIINPPSGRSLKPGGGRGWGNGGNRVIIKRLVALVLSLAAEI